ncbi:MAG: hypothetical protein E7616_06355 [Ruminococcaceae bacterium]|nr:hypothetical protein [Oscillospiraceae bacterium]
MLKILAIQTKEAQKALSDACGVTYIPTDMAYTIQVDEIDIGIIPFYIKGQEGYIRSVTLKPGIVDFEAQFIGGRGCMNFIDLCGAHDCYLLDPGDGSDKYRLAIALGFKPNNEGKWYMNLRGFFEDPCKHENQ